MEDKERIMDLGGTGFAADQGNKKFGIYLRKITATTST